MKVKILKTELLNGFRIAKLFSEATRTSAFTSSVAISASPDNVGLFLLATNLQQSCRVFVPAEITETSVDVMIPPENIMDFLNSLEKEALTLEITKNELRILETNFLVYDMKDFVFTEEIISEPVTLLSKDFLDGFTYVSKCANTSAGDSLNTRLIHLEKNSKGKIELVATNRVKLAYYMTSMDCEENVKVSVFVDYMDKLSQILKMTNDDTFDIRINEKCLQIFMKNIMLSCLIYNDEYFDYNSLLKIQIENKIVIKRLDLSKALYRILIFSKESKTTKNSGFLNFKGDNLTITGYGEKGKGKEKVPIITDKELNFEFPLDCKDLYDVITGFGKDYIELYASDSIPVVFVKEEQKSNYIFMFSKQAVQ